MQVAVLGAGNVSQGAFHALSCLGVMPRMFYRKTLNIFYDAIGQYAVIVNGIEVDDESHILDRARIRQTREEVRIIDAAADAGRAIAGTDYQCLDAPFGRVEGRRYFMVNNAPTLLHREASELISSVAAAPLLTQEFFVDF